jgi:hypothetical protein
VLLFVLLSGMPILCLFRPATFFNAASIFVWENGQPKNSKTDPKQSGSKKKPRPENHCEANEKQM